MSHFEEPKERDASVGSADPLPRKKLERTKGQRGRSIEKAGRASGVPGDSRKWSGKPGVTSTGYAPRANRPGKPAGKFPGKPLGSQKGKPMGRTPGKATATILGIPSQKPEDRSYGTPRDRRVGKPLGSPSGKPLGTSPSKPVGRPPGTLPGKPLSKPPGKPAGRPLSRSPIKPLSKPVGRPLVQRLPAATTAPKLTPMASAKIAWHPTLKWCQKQLREARWMDPTVLIAVQQFHTLVQALLAAPNPSQFLDAQAKAANYVGEHPFLRWAPVPSPVPTI